MIRPNPHPSIAALVGTIRDGHLVDDPAAIAAGQRLARLLRGTR